MKLTILAVTKENKIIPPRTKKNSAQMIPNLNRPLLVPSAAYLEWERAAIRTMLGEGFIRSVPGEKKSYQPTLGNPIGQPVNCRALIYRDALRGDAVGFYQAIGDFLELAGIVSNDKLIVSWDGSRLLKDPLRPRVEIEILPVGECVQGGLFS